MPVLFLADPGGVGGPGTGSARFTDPVGVASDGTGNLYVTDSGTIRKVLAATGDVTTLAGVANQQGSDDGIGAAARFNGPGGLASDGAGNLFVADTSNHTIRKIVIATGAVTTFAGTANGAVYGNSGSADGIGAAASFRYPDSLVSDGAEVRKDISENGSGGRDGQGPGGLTPILYICGRESTRSPFGLEPFRAPSFPL